MAGLDLYILGTFRRYGHFLVKKLLHSQFQGQDRFNAQLSGIDQKGRHVLQHPFQLQAVSVFRILHVHGLLKRNLPLNAM